ncbi:MAG: IS256 family transposase, partial [Candidatus Neomarinimicrobiota bacterium]
MKGKTMSLEKSTMIEDVMKLLIEYGPEKFRESLEMLYNQAMLLERSEVLRAHPYERTEARRGHANGFKPKRFNSSVGPLELQIPQVRGDVSFYPGSLERGTRSEKALKCALAEMYIQGVSTRKVREVTEALCGVSVSSSQVSRVTRELDESLSAFRDRELDDPYPYVYLDARYEKTRHNGRVIDSAVLIAVGVNKRTGLREVLGINTELSEAEVHWRHFLEHLQKRGLKGVELFISDDHSGLKAAR